ncbi:Y-family DNA polymerase [Dokdonella sp. MW10]|uniref:Y-family DNA polymerase n=1 Tax=Dokdonella sp. MW10 TaxID=2992926 RepID=UPI003F7F6851
MLWLCLHCPDLPLAAVRPHDAADTAATVLVDGSARQPRVVAVDAVAAAHGLRAGMPLAAARARLPALIALRRDTVAEKRLLATLADWAYRFSGEVCLAPPDALLVEVGASLSLFGGWPALERRLGVELATLGVNMRFVLAPVARAAQVLAAAGRDRLALPAPEPMLRELAGLPIGRSGLEATTARALAGMGLTTLGPVFALPRAELARRIGKEALLHLDRLRGAAPETHARHHPAVRYERRFEFDHRVESVQALAFPLQRLVREFARFLFARDGGVQRFELVLEHERGARTRVQVGLLVAQRDPDRLLEFARGRLERLDLVAPVEALVLRADDLPTLAPLHVDLFDDTRREALDWPSLAERLRARLGDEALQGLALVADHRPALAWTTRMPSTTPGKRDGIAAPGGARPLWLLAREIPLVPAPQAILAGPERIESGWWDGGDERRDYYVVRTRDGQRAWAYVAAGATQGWMLHGWFA